MRFGDLARLARHGCKQEICSKVCFLLLPLVPFKRLFFSQNQMFSKFNALGLDNLIQATLTRGSDITSDIESKLRG
jgi:hypothetical protein